MVSGPAWVAIAIWQSGVVMSTVGPEMTTRSGCLETLEKIGWTKPDATYFRTPHNDGEPIFVGCIRADISTRAFVLDLMKQKGIDL